MNPTRNYWPEAELKQIAKDVSLALQDNFLGFYLYGSVVMRAWDIKKSDIDFLVIMRHALSSVEKEKLKIFHQGGNESGIMRRLEGDYVELGILQRKELNRLAATVEDGNFCADVPCKLSADNLFNLIKEGKCLLGVPIEQLGISVSKEELIAAVSNMLKEDREKMMMTEKVDSCYTILVNSLRSIYVLETGQIPTKREAVEYARKLLGKTLYLNVIGFMEEGTPSLLDKKKMQHVIRYGIAKARSMGAYGPK